MLSTKLGPHQSSVSHTLKELMEEGLVVKKGKSYSLSNVGIIERNTMEWMGRTLGCLKDHRDFIQSHDLSGIPPGFQVTMGVVCERREIIETDPVMPNHIHEIIIPFLAKSRVFLGASSLVLEHQITVAQAVREGGHLHTVTLERIIQELRHRGSYPLRDNSLSQQNRAASPQ